MAIRRDNSSDQSRDDRMARYRGGDPSYTLMPFALTESPQVAARFYSLTLADYGIHKGCGECAEGS